MEDGVPGRTPGLRLRLLNRGDRLAPVLPRLGGADVTTEHEGLGALAAEPVTRFPSPRSEGFAHKFKALIQRRSHAGLPAEPAPRVPPNALSSSSSSSGNASARSVNTRSFER